MLKKIFNIFIQMLFPNKCISCEEILDTNDDLCDYCYEMMPRCEVDKFCLLCGNDKKECKCKSKIFHFNGCISPFFKTEFSKEIMYKFKFRKKEYISDFFAENMALSVKQAFPYKQFDYICEVPMRRLEKLKRGYNQSEILAIKLGKILGIKYYPNALWCNKKKTPQHKADIKLRFENVKGVYFTSKEFPDKIILLVDDIKTTGATLDQCARQLLIAGAKEVYCVAGLTTRLKGKEYGN